MHMATLRRAFAPHDFVAAAPPYWNEEHSAYVKARWQLSDDEPNAEGWRLMYQHDFPNFVKFRREYLQARDAIADAYDAAALKADLAFTDYLTAYNEACEAA